ncbi:MAG: hypothetical protein FJ405_03305, partial [Verrucomicrobia bacterium]|nr:hypothetical protein [Verrucomicrobiota bacterium]
MLVGYAAIMKIPFLSPFRLTWLVVFAVMVLAAPVRSADTQAPVILSVAPAREATVSALSQVVITFDEQITGVEAAAILINGNPAANVSGFSNRWTFFFAQPLPGAVTLRFALDHQISDLAGNRFGHEFPSATWSYNLQDTIAPSIASLHPPAGAQVAVLSEIQVSFSEAVGGLDASDLLINGQAATSLQGAGPGTYIFSFPPVSSENVSVQWKVESGIADLATPSNPFAGGGWSYTRLPVESFSGIVINEVNAENQSGIRDEDGSEEDWIELRNMGTREVSLNGWSLTDDSSQPGLWSFPDVAIPAGGYLVVFASGKNRRPTGVGSRLHTSFRLNGAGEYLGLFDASSPRRKLDEISPRYPEQRTDISWGRSPTGSSVYFPTPTPGNENSSGVTYVGITEQPVASVGSGFFRDGFDLALSSGSFGSRIYYTLDGSVPTELSSRYRGLIRIEGSDSRAVVTLRAVAFKTGLLPSATLTHSYLFLEKVPQQPSNPAGFPSTWVTLNNPEASSSTSADYGMDRRVVTNKNNRSLILEGLASLPTVSIVTATPLLFGNNGVYSRRHATNQQPVHAEMILPDGSVAFRQDCGLEIQGGSSPTDSGGDWKSKNLSLRMLFRGDFGPGTLQADLYEGSPVKEFDTLVLDAGLNMVWNHMTDGDQRNRGQYAREQFVNDMMHGSGILAPKGRFVHLYLNGLYWGIKNMHERPDSSWAARHMGGAREEYDIFKHEGTSAGLEEGTVANYNEMLRIARSGLAKNSTYEHLQQHLDVDWFINYMLVSLWAGNTDWDHHNWYAARRRTPGAEGWRFINWDSEHVLKSASEDRLSINNPGAPSELLQLLRLNAEFRLRFADHVQRLFFNGGIFYTDPTNRNWNPARPDRNRPAAAYMKIIEEIDPAIVAESARWGDVARANQPYTRDVEWMRELQSLLFITNSSGNTVNYFPTRSSNVLVQLRGGRLYPGNSEAPTFSQHGGVIPHSFMLGMRIATAGAIHFTLDGSDPRSYGSGGVSPSASLYAEGNRPLLRSSGWVKARTLNGTNWSALTAAFFKVSELEAGLRFSEIMYRPLGGDAFEFVELSNQGSTDIDLSQGVVEGINFNFPPSAVIPPGGVWVLASGVDTNAWKLRYPGVSVRGVYPGTLANNGETLTVRDVSGRVLASVTYNNKGGWPTAADGLGASLQRIDFGKDESDPSAWREGWTPSPGLPSAPPAPPLIQIHEVQAASTNGSPDFVELHNPGTNKVSLGSWSLTDDGNPRKYVFPPGLSIPAGGYVVVVCDPLPGPGLRAPFGLDRSGDQILLYDASTNRVDALTFGPQSDAFTLNRQQGRWQPSMATPGDANFPAPSEDLGALRINEWVSNAGVGSTDWVEIYNSSASVPLSLQGLALELGQQVHVVRYPIILAPGGHVQLFADEIAGPAHLSFKLPAAGGVLRLLSPDGAPIDSVTLATSAEGVSQGRLPDGAAPPFVSFPGSASPGAPNYQSFASGPVLTEVLAWNRSATPGPGGVGFPDWIELHNPSNSTMTIAGYTIEKVRDGITQFVFPRGASIPAQGRLVLFCDDSLLPSTEASAAMNSGFALPASGGDLRVVHPGGQIVSEVSFGFQIADLSIGVATDGSWSLLETPTPGVPNAAAAGLGDVTAVRINEWMARPAQGDDWFELHNPQSLPISLAGVKATDEASLEGLQEASFRPLSFIGAQGFQTLIADGRRSAGPDHVGFSLRAEGGYLRIYAASGEVLDSISYGSQSRGVSEGRLPDGSAVLVSFPQSSSPSESNWVPIPGLVFNEVRSNPLLGEDEFIEIANLTDAPISIEGWYLSDRSHDLRRYAIPGPAVVPARGYLSLAGASFNPAFKLDSPNGPLQGGDEGTLGDEAHLSEMANGSGLSGRRLKVEFGPMAAGSIGAVFTSTGMRYAGRTALTPGMSNSSILLSEVVVNEIHPDQPGLPGFIEIHNRGRSDVALHEAGQPARTARIRGGVSYDFPPGFVLPRGGFVQLVGFDPVADPAAAEGFRVRHQLPPSSKLLGPWSGRLGAAEDTLRLEMPSGVRPVGGPQAGSPVYVVADEIHYETSGVWPTISHSNSSLQRRVPGIFGDEPVNWFAGDATPGRPNRADYQEPDSDLDGMPDAWELSHQLDPSKPEDAFADSDGDRWLNSEEYLLGTNPRDGTQGLEAPVIESSPQSRSAGAGSSVVFTASANGAGLLVWQWWFDGQPLSGQRGPTLHLTDVQSDHAGRYYATVGNAAGVARTADAQLTIMEPPDILTHPQSIAVNPGTNVTLAVSAFTLNPPLRYQWMFNQVAIPGATGSTLSFTNIQLESEGDYTVLVGDAGAERTSLAARLTVR